MLLLTIISDACDFKWLFKCLTVKDAFALPDLFTKLDIIPLSFQNINFKFQDFV